MDVFLICVTVLASVSALRIALWPGADDPNWELRWRSLDPADRARLAAAGLPGVKPSTRAALVKPEEDELAKGFNRRESRRRAYFEVALAALLILAVALALAGVLPFSVWGLILAGYGFLLGPVTRLRDRQIKGRSSTGAAAD